MVLAARRRHSLKKLVTRMIGHIDPLFSTCSHSLWPVFYFAITQWPPFWKINSQVWMISHQKKINKQTNKTKQNHAKMCILHGRLAKSFTILSNWPPFSSFHWMTPYFEENPLTERPLSLSQCPTIPVTSKVGFPSPLRLEGSFGSST